MAFWDGAWDAISGAGKWLGKQLEVQWIGWTTIKQQVILSVMLLLVLVVTLRKKQAGKDLINQQRELLNLQDQMKSKYSAVPDADWSYKSLTVDDSPGLANGGILTEMKKRSETKGANNGRVA